MSCAKHACNNVSFCLELLQLNCPVNNEVTTGQSVRPSFFYFLFYRFFSQQVSVGGRNKDKNKIHSDHFPIELKSKETQCVSFDFNSIGKWSECILFYQLKWQYLTRCCHWG